MTKTQKSINQKILLTTSFMTAFLALILVLLMIYFMNHLTSALLSKTLEPMARSAAQTVEGNLHLLVDRVAMIRDSVMQNPDATDEDKLAVLNYSKSGIEFSWLAIYDEAGRLIVGSGQSPEITSDKFLSTIRETANIAIQDTSRSGSELEIAVGAPLEGKNGAVNYLIGSYSYRILNDILTTINISLNSEALIINGDGLIMAHTDVNKTLTSSDLAEQITKKMQQGQIGFESFDGVSEKMIAGYAPVRGANWFLAITAPQSDFRATTVSAIWISVAVTILLLAVIIFLMQRTISVIVIKPLNRLGIAADSISAGNMNVSLQWKTNDEIGALFNNFAKVKDTVNNLIESVTVMSNEHNMGHTNARIDESVFAGAYGQVAFGVNKMVSDFMQIINEIIVDLEKMSDGDFNVRFPELNGDHKRLSVTMEAFRRNLSGIGSDINKLAGNAANGDLSVRIDTDSYQGGWRELMDSLNRLIESVAAPIGEAQEALEQLALGKMNVSIKGCYKGDFEKIKTSVNNVSVELLGYIDEISTVLGKTAHKNLTASIGRDYLGDFIAIKDSINMINKNLDGFVREIQAASEQVNTDSEQISQMSAALAENALSQTNSIETLKDAIDVINRHALEGAEHAADVNRLSLAAKESTHNGREQMEGLMQSMSNIKAVTENIAKLVNVIDNIAMQTNLLALNASVEAVRAGQAGKGFTVVAEEVRSLALRSKESAGMIRNMIEDARRQVSEGMQLANSTSEAITTVMDDVDKVSDHIADISRLLSGQAESVASFNDMINRIGEIIQENSSMSEESSMAAQELSDQSAIMYDMIAAFELKK